MERDANYVAVGAFVLLVIVMGVAFVLWYSGGRDRRDYQMYEIYFDGTVSGLTKGGPVRYLGVDVGRVRRMLIDPQRPGQVKVLAEIDTSAPIDGSTRASLGLQGVTGLLYIDLKSDPTVPVGTPLAGGKEYPVIESVASDFDIFLSSLPELVGRATTVIDRLGDLISRENVAALSATIESLRATSVGLPGTAARVDRLLDELHTTASEATETARTVRGFVTDADPKLRAAVDRMGQLADDLATTAERLDHFAAETESQVGHFTDHGLFELEQLLRESRAAAREFRTLSRELRRNPSQILYEPKQTGVEIAP